MKRVSDGVGRFFIMIGREVGLRFFTRGCFRFLDFLGKALVLCCDFLLSQSGLFFRLAYARFGIFDGGIVIVLWGLYRFSFRTFGRRLR